MSSPSNLADLELVISGGTVGLYASVASLALLGYDTIITTKEEVKYFWVSRTSLVQIVFFMNRYNGLIAVLFVPLGYVDAINATFISESTEGRYMGWLHQMTGWLSISLLDIILLVRVVALYERRKILSVCLSFLLLLEAATMLFLLLHIEIRMDVSIAPLTAGTSYCTGRGFLKLWATGFWIPPAVYQLVLLCLVIAKARRLLPETGSQPKSRLISVFVQDQVLYSLVLLTCGSTSVMAYWINNDNYRAVASGFAYAIPCIIGSRLLMNLKEAGEKDSLGIGNGTHGTLSAMVFGVDDCDIDDLEADSNI